MDVLAGAAWRHGGGLHLLNTSSVLPVVLFKIILAVVVALVAYVVLRLARFFATVRRMRKISADIPGPAPLPFIGNVLDVMKGDDQLFKNCCDLMNAFGPTVRVWLGTELVVAISDADDIAYLSTSQELIDKSKFYSILEPFLGLGLSCLGGAELRRHRRLISPFLNSNALRDFIDVFNKKSLEFADRLEPLAQSGEEFDVSVLCLDVSLDSALETIMSSDIKDSEEKIDFIWSIKSATKLFMFRILHPWFIDDQLFRLSHLYGEYKKTVDILNRFTAKIIDDKRKQIESSAEPPKEKRLAFLDNILWSKEGAALSNVELRDEVKTLLCTGSETSASTLSFIFQVLALRPDVQAKMQQELDDVFGSDLDRPLTLEELPHLVYMDRVIKETLRMFPVLPFFTRNCPQDVTLPSGYTAPRGAHLVFFLPYLHRNPKHFENPNQFNPDRFLPENSSSRHPYSFLPFSYGPRSCVGLKYAMMLLKAELSTLLRRYNVLPPIDCSIQDVSQVPVRVSLVIEVKGGVRIRLEKRNLCNSSK